MPALRLEGGGDGSEPRKPKPPVYYFNGRTYSSYNAYVHAVQAYNVAQSQKRAGEAARRAAAQRRQRAAQQRRVARRTPAAPVTEAQVSRATLSPAERRAFEARVALQRRRQHQSVLAQRRREAWDALQQRVRGTRLMLERVRDEQAQGKSFATRSPSVRKEVLDAGLGLDATERERIRLLNSAEDKRDFTNLFQHIREQQVRTGGRYVDRVLFTAASDSVAKTMKEIRGAWQRKVDRFYDLFHNEKWAEANALVQSDDFAGARHAYIRFFGDGRKPGLGQRLAALQSQIADTQDRFLELQISGGKGFGAHPKSDADIEALWRQFQSERSPFHGVKPGRAGGPQAYATTKPISLNRWLRDQAEIEHARIAESYQRLPGIIRASRAQGIDVMHTPDGGVQFVKHEDVVNARSAFNLFVGDGSGWGGVVDERRYRQLIGQLSGPAADSQAALRELMNLGTEAYRKRNSGFLDHIYQSALHQKPVGNGANEAFAALGKVNSQTDAFRRWLYQVFTGQAKDTGVFGALQDLSFAPVSGDVLNALGTGIGGVGSLVRLLSRQAGGRLTVPDIDFSGADKSGGGVFRTRDTRGRDIGFGPVGIDRTRAARGEEERAVHDLMAVIGDPNADLGRKLDAIRIYGQDFAEGDLSIIPQTLLDPLTFVSGAGFLRGGRLAIARAGGVRAAGLAPRTTVADFIRLSLPKHFAGTSPERIAELTERMGIARDLGKRFDEVANLSNEDVAKLAQETMSGSVDDVLRRGVVERLLDASPLRAQQVVAAVSEEFKRRAARLGHHVDARQLAGDARYARNALRRAEREAAADAARKAVQASDAAGAQAAEKVRAELVRKGVAPAVQKVAGLSPVQLAKRSTLVRQYEKAATERLAAVQEATVAHEALQVVRDRLPRQQHYREFESAVQRLRAIDESPGLDPTGARIPAPIERYRRDLEDFDAQTKYTSDPGFAGLSRQRVATDYAYTGSQLTVARQRLAAATTPGQVAFWEGRIKRLQSARAYFRAERDRLLGVHRTAAATVRQYRDQAMDLIRPQQVAAKALDGAGARAELARDLHVAAQRPVVQVVQPLQRRESAALSKIEGGIGQHLDLTGIPELDPLVKRFGAVDPLALADGILAVDWPAGAAYEVQQRLRAAVVRSMRAAGMSPDIPRFIEWRQRAALSRAAGGWKAFRGLDSRVQTSIRSARGWIAKGSIKVRRGSGAATRLSAPDPGLTEVYAKVAVLSRQNVSIFAYDQARYVLRKPMLKHGRGVEIRRLAQAQSAHTGRDLGEAFDEIREARRATEVVRNLEEYAARPEMRGLTPEEVFNVFEAELLDQDLRPVAGGVSSYQAQVLANAFKEVSGATLGDTQAVARALAVNAPPLDNWGEARKWLVDNGHWSPRTADDIRLGKRVWSVEEERAFWHAGYGVEPRWLKADELTAALESKDVYDSFMRETGRYDEEFERLATMSDLTPEEVRDSVVWGGNGISEARTYGEIRQWMIDRYGDLVADANGLIRAPWLMDPRALEYRKYIRRVFGAAPDAGRLRTALGFGFDDGLVREGQIAGFGRAVERAVDKRLTRLLKDGKMNAGDDWLPQEQNAFVFDVVDHLLAEQSWRGFFERKPVVGRVVDAIGTFWRAAITWTLAFPIANLADAFGLKRLLLIATENDFRPLSMVSREAREAIPDLRSIGLSRSATWYTRGRNGLVNVRDSQFSAAFRLREGVRGVFESPLRVSRAGEERLMLDFARTRFDDHFRSLVELGVDPEQARVRALSQAKRVTDDWFPNMEGAGSLERVINQLVPFLSYNIRTKVLSITRFGLQNPWLLLVSQRLGDFFEEQNRRAWEAEHDEPWDPSDPRARRFQIRVGDQTYAIDLTIASDWTRGLSTLFESHDPQAWAFEFFRVPHPSQAIFLAAAFGFNDGKTPWGTEARWGDVSVWFDFASWAMGNDVFSPDNPKGKDAVQAWSQLLTFKAFSRIDPVRAKVNQYFAFRQISPDKAREYLRENPDLQAYFALTGNGAQANPLGEPTKASWFRDRDQSEIDAFEAAMSGYTSLKQTLDAKLDQFYLTPWDPAYAGWKKKRRVLLTAYIRDHPILSEVWNFWTTPKEWAEEMDNWRVDEMVDQFFGLDKTRPDPADFKGELDFQKALDGWFDMRRLWLEAHPKVYDRLHHARNAVEQAWFDQELHWSEILDHQAAVRIRLLEEEASGAPNDAAIKALHSLSDANYLTLDAEAFGQFYDLLDSDVRSGRDVLAPRFHLPDVASSLIGRLKGVVTFPGRGDYVYRQAGPKERREIDRRDRYVRHITSFVDGLKDPRLFWSELEKRPDLLREYLRRNPEREVDYRYATRIGAIIRASSSGKDFYDRLNADPWLKAQYFARHPDKEAAFRANTEYMSWMRRWVSAIDRGNHAGADDVWKAMPAWVHDRYLSAHPDSGMASGGRTFRADGKFFSSAESRQRYVDGVTYFAAMERWVGLLKGKQYDDADRLFRSFPDWVREKYFAKHPDQRARFELDSTMLRVGAEYFLAKGDDKLKVLARSPELRRWLAAHGGDEAVMRGLLLSAYRAIPAGEEWLRRTFREHYPEVFSKQAAGESRLRSVARDLAAHPDLEPFYLRALRLQQQTFLAQLRRSGTPPKPLHYDRKRRLAKRRRRRAARFNAHWTLHRELRLDIRAGAGSA